MDTKTTKISLSLGLLLLAHVGASQSQQTQILTLQVCNRTQAEGSGTVKTPENAEANAKAIVWGFIAGFSERFVPDILNRLGSEGTDERGSKQ